MEKQITYVQKSSYRKAWMSAGIFLATVVVGGLAIFAATNLDDLEAGTNGNTLTAESRDAVITRLKDHDLLLGITLDTLVNSSSENVSSSNGDTTELINKLTAVQIDLGRVISMMNSMPVVSSGEYEYIVVDSLLFACREGDCKLVVNRVPTVTWKKNGSYQDITSCIGEDICQYYNALLLATENVQKSFVGEGKVQVKGSWNNSRYTIECKGITCYKI